MAGAVCRATAERPAGYPFTYMDPKKFPNELGQFVDFGNNRHIRGVEKQMDPLGECIRKRNGGSLQI
jgi:hypothetical protein